MKAILFALIVSGCAARPDLVAVDLPDMIATDTAGGCVDAAVMGVCATHPRTFRPCAVCPQGMAPCTLLTALCTNVAPPCIDHGPPQTVICVTACP